MNTKAVTWVSGIGEELSCKWEDQLVEMIMVLTMTKGAYVFHLVGFLPTFLISNC